MRTSPPASATWVAGLAASSGTFISKPFFLSNSECVIVSSSHFTVPVATVPSTLMSGA